MPTRKNQKVKQPFNVMSDNALGDGFKRYTEPNLHVFEETKPLADNLQPLNDVNRTVRLALESILIARKEVKAVIVMSTNEENTVAKLFTTSEKSHKDFLVGTLITITEQKGFVDEECYSFSIDPLVGHESIGEDGKERIKDYLNKQKDKAKALEVVVVYKDSVTTCGNLPLYIHYDFA